MVARSKEEQRRSLDWYRRLADDIEERKEVRRLEKIGDAFWDIFAALQHELSRPHDLSEAGKLPEGVSGAKKLPNPPPRRGRG